MVEHKMGKTLYLECRAGISGDMFVASLIDLGASQETLRKGLESLGVEGFDIMITRVKKSELDACDFDVVLDAEHENHDHDMEYLHGSEATKGNHEHVHEPDGHEHGHSHEHGDTHGHGHNHEHGDTHGHGHNHEYGHNHEHGHGHNHGHDQDYGHGHDHDHSHVHRGLPEIYAIIERANITRRAKDISRHIFDVLAEAEGKAHGVPTDQVHFHEVGAVDSIADVVAAGICLDDLDVGEVIVPELWEGTGTVRCQHGILPVPVPAVANIVSANRIKLHVTDVQGELVTPTGAAIVAAIRTSDALPERFLIEKIGLGAGKREYGTAGIVRAMLIRGD